MRPLIIPNSRGIAHKIRAIELAKAFKRHGHDPLVATILPPELDSADVPHIPYETHTPRAPLSPAKTTVPLEAAIANECALIERTRPDIVITDLVSTARISTALTNTPHAAIVNYGDLVDQLPVRFAESSIIYSLANFAYCAFPALKTFSLSSANKPFNDAAKRTGVSLTFDGTSFLHGNTYTFLPDHTSLFPSPKALPQNAQLIGPIFSRCTEKPNPNKKRTTIAACFGATGYLPALQITIDALDGLPYDLAVSTSLREIPLQRRTNPLITSPFIDVPTILEDSALLVCNASALIIYQAIATKTPIIAIPLNLGQSYYADTIERLGIGKRIEPRNLTRKTLREYAETILSDPSYIQRMPELGENTALDTLLATLSSHH